jgi:hypothetical protein
MKDPYIVAENFFHRHVQQIVRLPMPSIFNIPASTDKELIMAEQAKILKWYTVVEETLKSADIKSNGLLTAICNGAKMHKTFILNGNAGFNKKTIASDQFKEMYNTVKLPFTVEYIKNELSMPECQLLEKYHTL